MFNHLFGSIQAKIKSFVTRAAAIYQKRVDQAMAAKAKVETTYKRYEKYLPAVAFATGFTYDSLTLTRIDLALDNLILLGYTLAAGALIAVIGMVENNRLRKPFITEHLDWINFGIHFFIGGLLSSYVVFYFQSADVAKSYIFIGLLLGLLITNEFFAERIRSLKMLMAIYFFSCFAFFTFFVPWLIRHMGLLVFIASGILSLALVMLIWFAIKGSALRHSWKSMLELNWPPLLIFLALLLFYFQNWMPPVPLALKEAGVYREVTRTEQVYEVRYSKPKWWQLFKDDDSHFKYSEGDTVYCFTAIFAPTQLEQRIIHFWQKLDPEGGWQTTDRIPFDIVGGRDGGWRGYTYKRNVSPGEWRVEVMTSTGRQVGRVRMEIVATDQKPEEFVTEKL